MEQAKKHTLLDAAAVTGQGSEVYAGLDRKGMTAVEITITGAPTAVTVDLEGALEAGGTKHQLDQHVMSAGELSAAKALYFVANKPIPYLTANLTTLAGGASPTVTVKIIAQ